MGAPVRIDSYGWAGGREAMLRFGPDDGPIAIAALPLFEEANRTRAFAVAILRALADRGIGGVLPDLPGTGESLVATRDARLSAMCDAYAALADQLGGHRRSCAIGVRSGALIDTCGSVAARWHLAPQSGEAMLRELWRVRQASTGDRAPFAPAAWADPHAAPLDFAGNRISPAMIAELMAASPAAGDERVPLRTVRLDSDARPADRTFAGAPLWRRAEPGNDRDLADRLAGDVAEWIRACVR